jgi:hypothetical protein
MKTGRSVEQAVGMVAGRAVTDGKISAGRTGKPSVRIVACRTGDQAVRMVAVRTEEQFVKKTPGRTGEQAVGVSDQEQCLMCRCLFLFVLALHTRMCRDPRGGFVDIKGRVWSWQIHMG